MRRLQRRGRGQALVEFALIIPIFLVILFAIFDGGRLVFMNTQLRNIANEAVRNAIVDNRSVDCPGALVADAATCAKDLAIAQTALGAPITAKDAYCALPDGTKTACDFGRTIVLVLEVNDVSPITPLVGNIIGPLTLSAEVQMAIE